MDVCCNGISEHKQAAEREAQTELLAQFLSKPSNISTIELSLGDHHAASDLHVSQRILQYFQNNTSKLISQLRDVTPPLPASNQYWILSVTARAVMR